MRAMLQRLSLTTRIFLALLGMVGVVVVLLVLVTRWNFDRGFLGYLNDQATERMATVQPRLVAAYREHGNWDFLRGSPRHWFALMRPPAAAGGRASEHHGAASAASAGAVASPAPAPSIPVSDLTGAVQRLGLLDAQDQWVAGFREIDPGMRKVAIEVDGARVGWLVSAPFEAVADGAERRFERGQFRALWGLVVVVLLVSAGAAWWVARAILAPVSRVAQATHQLAAGDHGIRVPVSDKASPNDVVARLSADFNHLAVTLQHNERLRRDFMADISHELRTPLAVLRGELEALEDGVRPLDAAAVASLQAEVARLGALVNDLYELALSDVGALGYRMGEVDLSELAATAVQQHRGRLADAGLTLTQAWPAEAVRIWGDDGRLQQLLDNLLENSRRYTDAPGEVRLTLTPGRGHCELRVEDSAPGVPAAEAERLFERFYRLEGSRSRAHGGAGLGLALCRNIVEAHGGEIHAHPSPLGGVAMVVRLPLGPSGEAAPRARSAEGRPGREGEDR